MKPINAEILTIGDEILYGQIVDTNSQWICSKLDELGIKIVRKVTVGDIESHILESFASAEKEADLVLITGGLGPTNDDLTKPCLAKYFDSEIVMNEEALAQLKVFFDKRGFELNELNRKQAELPEKCTMIPNPMGTATGMWFEKNGKVFVSMPGVPHEMKNMMKSEILPRVKEYFNPDTIVHKLVKTCGIGESWLAEKIEDWENSLPEHIKLAYLPSPGIVKLRLTATGDDADRLKRDIDLEIDRLKPFAGKYIFGYDKDTLEESIGRILKSRGQTMAVAESCTGGFLAHQITSIPGSSEYFKGGIVAYSNEVKISQLGVNAETIEQHGAVSEQTVAEMANRVREKYNTDIGIATSGIAGPGGGTPEKPVGTVWIAYADGEETKTRKLQLVKERLVNIRYSTVGAATLVWKSLKQKIENGV